MTCSIDMQLMFGGNILWKSYEQLFNRKYDFRVKYSLKDSAIGGRKHTYQGIRFNFAYENFFVNNEAYIIHPEFENEHGDVIYDLEQDICRIGTARMWILYDEMRPYHKEILKIGTRGYMIEGSKIIGEVEVIELNFD